MGGTIQPLTTALVPQTAALLAAALDDDPAYDFLFPAGPGKRGALTDFFTGHLGNHVPHRCSFVRLDDRGQVEATVTVRPPGGIAIAGRKLLLGLLRLAWAHGPSAVSIDRPASGILQRRAPPGDARRPAGVEARADRLH